MTYDPLDTDRVVIDNMKRRQVEPGVWVPSLADGADMSAFVPSPDDKMGPYLVIKVNILIIFVSFIKIVQHIFGTLTRY